MAKDVEAVIAALRVVLRDAEMDEYRPYDINTANRWIEQLPGSWRGKWRHLKVSSRYGWTLEQREFIAQVGATLAYLETNKDAIMGSSPFSFSGLFRRRKEIPSEPLEAEFSEVPSRSRSKRASPTPVKLIKKD